MQLNFDGQTVEDLAILRLKEFEPKDGYYVAFSGGKDSICVYQLCVKAGVKFDAHYNVTGIDPPELVAFMRREYPDVIFHKPLARLWDLMIDKNMPPTRLVRYCCEYLKEHGGEDRVVVTGVRWAESAKRQSRRSVEQCKKGNKRMIVNPIVDWTDEDVWSFIRRNNFPYPSLYDEGFKRLGCVGCPMAGPHRKEQFARWPQLERAWKRAFVRMNEARRARGKGEYSWEWWMEQESNEDSDQTILFE